MRAVAKKPQKKAVRSAPKKPAKATKSAARKQRAVRSAPTPRVAKAYNHTTIEKKWQRVWEKTKAHVARMSRKKKFFGLIEFPYPSGEGLHAGHVRSNTAMDVIARKRRAEGFEVLYPIGWDAFGLPTENYAIKTGIHPIKVTKKNTDTFRRQLKSLGFSFDWSREINTTDPAYYKWTQWIFLQLYKNGLAYKAKTQINWCPKCKIGLANEEVIGTECERCHYSPIEKREKEQWMLAITKYAQRLYDDLDTIDYIERAKVQQRNWIGPSRGIFITYPIEGQNKTVTVFTTRPDTNFGATFLVAAPDGEFVTQNIDLFPAAEGVRIYRERAKQKTEIERMSEGRKKTGVFTGWYALNQLSGKRIPIYVSDFVLGHVGSGVVVGVPGHDLRDFEFAQAMNLEIVRVVVGADGDASEITHAGQVQEESGRMIHSGFLDGLDIHDATETIMNHLEEKGWGKRVTTYKLRDWVFSRQRYWGEPIPMVHCEKCGWVPVPEQELPVKLPKVEKYQPTDTGESPLAAMEKWVKTKCPTCKGPARRETDVMPNWAGSSWYYLRYTDPKNTKAIASKDALKYWTPVDWYNGGMEHTTLHLLYSRFWHKFLFDIGVVPTSEPYAKRTSHGLILAGDGTKMSKSKGNVVNPDSIVVQLGADSLRLYEMFMGPFDQEIAWNTEGVVGVRRFLERTWRLLERVRKDDDPALVVPLNQTIKKVGDDIEQMKFNTAVSNLMIFLNAAEKAQTIGRMQMRMFVQLLAPFAPHIAEELWQVLGGKKSVHAQTWPTYDTTKLTTDTARIALQINGKLRGIIDMPRGSTRELLESAARDALADKLTGKEVLKVVVVPDRLVNIVVGEH